MHELRKFSLDELLRGTPFVSYAYSYPHKLAYRPLTPIRPLSELWLSESRDALFLYFHIPFCEYRCGFCNLFTQSQPLSDVPDRYLDQLKREAEQVREALGDCNFARMAIGGGTPTFLSLNELEKFWRIATEIFGVDSRRIPTSVEASPATINSEKLFFLRDKGVERLSLGVQSFDDATSGRLGRPQRRVETNQALSLLHDARFPILNLDLIYGAESQSIANWVETVRLAIEHQPQELYLYPLYVREQTGLGRRLREWDDLRLIAYRTARDLLLTAGYEQISFRMFSRAAPSAPQPTTDQAGAFETLQSPKSIAYDCQSDGMVGLGCGARSYTSQLHYSTDYAVSQSGVKAILGDYLRRPATDFSAARNGIFLNGDEQRRRFVILALLQRSGLNCADYQNRFHSDPFITFPELEQLVSAGLARNESEILKLTKEGIEWSDAIGPWLGSQSVRNLTEERAACLT